MSIYDKIPMPYVYGPLNLSEVESIAVSKHQIPEPDGWYVGTSVEIPHLASKKVFKWIPPVLEAPPTEETSPAE